MSLFRRLDWRGPPLALQIMALLVAGLVVAQLVTLFLTLVLPPQPTPQYGLDSIGAALADANSDANSRRGLQRIVQKGPPDVSGPGWLVSEKSRRDLARMIGVSPDRVSLAFYTPLPFAGTASARPTLAMADDGPVRTLAGDTIYLGDAPAKLVLAQYAPPAVAMPRAETMRANVPHGDADRALRAIPRDAFPPGLFPGQFGPGGNAAREAARNTGNWQRHEQPLITVDGRGGLYISGDGGAAVPDLLKGGATTLEATRQPVTGGSTATAATAAAQATQNREIADAYPIAGSTVARTLPTGVRTGPPFSVNQMPAVRQALPDASALMPLAPGNPQPAIAAPLLMPSAPSTLSPRAAQVEPHVVQQLPQPGTLAVPQVETAPQLHPAQPVPEQQSGPVFTAPPAGPPIAVSPSQRSLFGLAPAPFVQGDFVAALELPDGRWAVVQPAAEPFPNAWQRRVLLWFAIALGVVLPFGWLFSRRLVTPLDRFASAAEQLGRDPSVVIGALDGPAEIGRAAHAFNLMQGRIRSFVDDRTAMIGAISHDLRTPLTRMRFRIEDVEADDVRDGLLEEVDEMEAMIAQVIDFIRDASNTNARERLDLRTLVDDVVEDARLVGSDVTIERADAAPVEVDVLGMRRLLDNLLENAVKYGERARIRLTTEADQAVAEIIDDGPGLPDDEIERVFEPFYRSEAARNSDKGGSGLGLAVCRSIARAHGGDVTLMQRGDGFRAQIRVPLAYDRPALPA